MSWCFGIVNNRLAEVYFDRKKDRIIFYGHCYVKEAEYTTKGEKAQIRKDIEKLKLVYRKGMYKEKTFVKNK